jgi:hypothetical protein
MNKEGSGGGGNDAAAAAQSSPKVVLRRSNSGVSVLHQKQLPSYTAERLYILSELQLHSVPPTFLSAEHDDGSVGGGGGGGDNDNVTVETADMHSLEGRSHNSSQDASGPLTLHHHDHHLPLQPYSILYLTWKPSLASPQDRTGEESNTTTTTTTPTRAVTTFVEDVVVPAVHRIQNITRIRRPSMTHSTTSSLDGSIQNTTTTTNHETDDGDGNQNHSSNCDEPPPSPTRQSLFTEQFAATTTTDILSSTTTTITGNTSTRLYLVVEQVVPPSDEQTLTHVTKNDGTSPGEYFAQLERYATELARTVSTHMELRQLVQGITVGVSNLPHAAPGLEACMNAFLVGSRDRRRYTASRTNRKSHRTTTDASKKEEEEDQKSLIGLIAETYGELEGPTDDHQPYPSPAHTHSLHQAYVASHQHHDQSKMKVQQCLVTVEWSAAGDLMSFAHRAHAVWLEQHGLPPPVPVVPPSGRKRVIPRLRDQYHATGTAAAAGKGGVKNLLWDLVVWSVLLFYFWFHYRHIFLSVVQWFWET